MGRRSMFKIMTLLAALMMFLAGCGRSGAPGRRFARSDVPVPVIVEEVQKRYLTEFIRITGKNNYR